MPFPLRSALAAADRKVLIVFSVVVLALLAAAFVIGPTNPQMGFGIPSSYSYGPGGARAAYELLTESGYNVVRWEKSPMDLPSAGAGAVLILAQPVYPAAEDERLALSRFLRTGGRILATGGAAARSLLPEGEAAYEDAWPGETKTYPALLPSPITLEAGEIELVPESSWSHPNSRQLPLYGSESQPVVVIYRLGEGRVIWWAGAWPLTNLGITSKQNLQLFLNSVGPSQGAHILWDEYFHGERGSLWGYLRATPVPWAGVQLGLFAVALVATFGRRWGPLRPRRSEARLSPLEFVETLGGLYERAHAAAPAVNVALQRFRFLLTRRLGLPANIAVEDLARAARERLGVAAEGLADTLARAEAAAGSAELRDAAALALVRSLHDYALALRLTPRPSSPAVSSSLARKEGS